MRCHACGATIEAHVFPGAVVRCACGADCMVPAPGEAPPDAPYRQAARPTEPPPATATATPATSHDLGPLCPRCTRLLQDDDAQAAFTCDRCGGLWMEHGVLAARVQAERPASVPAPVPARGPAPVHAPEPSAAVHRRAAVDAAQYARCPECGQVMTPMNFGRRSGVLLDVCRDHGTWLDRGELDAVLGFVRAGGLEADPGGVRPTDEVHADDPSARAAMAMLAVQAAYDERALEQDANDLAHYLLTGYHRPGYWSDLRTRRSRHR